MSLKALVVRRDGDRTSRAVETLDDDSLPEGEVTVDVEYSTINYKDGLCLTGQRGLVREFPHVPGIDFAGTVRSSAEDRFKPGDKVVLTGWGVGENRWGGYASRARVKAGWLVPLPRGLSTRQAMAVGTAGLTAMLAIMSLEEHGLTPEAGEVLVTGASGGVGSVAVALLDAMGYGVAAVTGRPENDGYLRELGAKTIIPRTELAEPTDRPLESERWAGCIDSVGGVMLARVLGQLRYGGSVASVGLAGGAELPATVLPFLLRGVNILGIDSVYQPLPRRLAAWERLARTLPPPLLDLAMREVTLEEVAALGDDILQGKLTGRTVVRLGEG
ncbi:MDR family oxidoreductase [Paracoccus sp. (in: a-proteobacteria)]|uniref:MDR family oxidoreductase n=1 Tax=Paracoccus sp. TaxID=267 RepID=UPI0035B0BDFF